jgi:stage II sporulation SpoE-like protein/GAF domain-containing protein
MVTLSEYATVMTHGGAIEAEVQVSDDDPPGSLLPPRLKPVDANLDLSELAWQILEAVVPGFADAAGVYALEELLRSGSPATQASGTELLVRRLGSVSTAGRMGPEAGFPPGEVIAFAPGSPYARSVRDRAPVIFAQPDGTTLQRIMPGAQTFLAGYTSFIAAPMITRGVTVGFLVLSRAPTSPSFGGHDTVAATDLATRTATGIASSLALIRHRSVAEALQRRPPAVTQTTPARLEIAGRCLPAEGYEVGGDWYDIVPLPGGRTGLIVGDIMGHGASAAAVMAQLSTTAFALADAGLPPADVLRQLNRTALALPESTLVTCAYAIIDPAAQSCEIAAAGHLPPVLAMPNHTTRVPELPGGQSLGVGPASYGQAFIKLTPGTILALYTDGLVETRTRSFDQGILALRSALAQADQQLDPLCEELVSSLGKHYEDDITVVLARILPEAAQPEPAA